LYVDNLETAMSFYRDVLGLDPVAEEVGRHVFFRCGQRMFLIFFAPATLQPGAPFPPHGASGPGHVAFGAREEELPRWREHLAQCGVAIETEVMWPNGTLSIYFRDPAGNSVELASPRLWSIDEEKFFGL
jgi:catechol 2,3-dioxygenase-like lactoylglutathione lyase family enzyme